MMKVVISTLAEMQIARAALDYDKKCQGLGLEFLDEVRASVGQISLHPHAWRRLGASSRRIMLNRFPWGLIYRVANGECRVNALIHLHSDPESWDELLN